MSPSNITVLHSFKGEVALRALQEDKNPLKISAKTLKFHDHI